MRVLICGGRTFSDSDLMRTTLEKLIAERGPITCLIHGAYRGADQLADYWAKKTGTPLERYPAEWHALGPAAGPIRNARMLKQGRPDLVVAFAGDKGTADMIEKAKRAGVPVMRVRPAPKKTHYAPGEYARMTRG